MPDRGARMPGSTARVISARPKKLASNMRADLGVLALLDRREIAVAGIVDEHVDAAEARLGRLDRFGDLVRLGDVEAERERLLVMAGDEIGDLRGCRAP